jgi:gamma-glutamylcyclotransferase (GGCT)/AIG2-like uncharacterized protein YtfP
MLPLFYDEDAYLFAYGTLGPINSEAVDREGWAIDAVLGRLFDLGPYPALVDLDAPGTDWVEGHMRTVTERELLERLDPYEGVDQGLFERRLAILRSGRRAWVYVYLPALPQYARGPLARWSGPRVVLT